MIKALSNQNALRAMFPATLAVYYSAQLPQDAQLIGAENLATEKMVTKRLNEYTHGRYCARMAQQQLGITAVPVSRGNDRAPIWQDGITGSIAHTAEMAAAIVGHSKEFLSVGLDIESDEPLSDDLLPLICRDDEHVGGDGHLGKLLFGTKEAVYKCVYPLIKEFVDFREMHIQLDAENHSFIATSQCKQCPRELTNRLRGRYVVQNGLILAGAWIEA